MPYKHRELVEIAARWLRGRRCFPVICESNSCREAPDAIGWNPRGSTVVECKTSIADFRSDHVKYRAFRIPGTERILRGRSSAAVESVELPRMGTRRYIMCEHGLITADMLPKYASGHGLVWVKDGKARETLSAPIRIDPDYLSEIRLLRLHWAMAVTSEDIENAAFTVKEEAELSLFDDPKVPAFVRAFVETE